MIVLRKNNEIHGRFTCKFIYSFCLLWVLAWRSPVKGKLGDYKGRKVTKLDFWKKFLIWRYSRKGLQISIGWLIGSLVDDTVFSETALRIFLIFCMKLGDYKGRKVAEPDIWEKFLIWRYSRKGLQISIGWLVGWLVSNAVFSETALRVFWFFAWG